MQDYIARNDHIEATIHKALAILLVPMFARQVGGTEFRAQLRLPCQTNTPILLRQLADRLHAERITKRRPHTNNMGQAFGRQNASGRVPSHNESIIEGFPLKKLRKDTPATRELVHFNNAGCSLPAAPTLKATLDYLELEAAIGGYEAFGKSSEALSRPYSALASLLNCQPSEIAIVTSATEAWQQVVYGLAWQWKPGDRLVTSVAEYGSNMIAYLQLRQRTGVRIDVVPETAGGDIDLGELEALIMRPGQPKPVLISISHIPTSSGRVYDATGVGRIARKHGILYMLDACQTIGQMPLDVQAVQCDFLSGTGRKFLRAPRGSGFLYASSRAMERFEPAHIDNTGATWASAGGYELRSTAKRFESYEMSFAAKVGLGVAVEYCLELGIEAIWRRVQHLAHLLRAGLLALPGVHVWDHGKVLCGIISFTKDSMSADEVQKRLAEKKINVAVSRVGSSRLDFEARGLQEVVRASVHYYNTEGEVQALLAAL